MGAGSWARTGSDVGATLEAPPLHTHTPESCLRRLGELRLLVNSQGKSAVERALGDWES